MTSQERKDWDSVIRRAAIAIDSGVVKPEFMSLAIYLNMSNSSLNAAFNRRGISKSTLGNLGQWVRHHLDGMPEEPAAGAGPVASETIEENGNTLNVTLRNTPIHTLEQLVKYAKIDLNIWRVERMVVNSWEMGRKARVVDLKYDEGKASGSVVDTGEVTRQQLFQVKATLVKRVEKLAVQAELEAMRAASKAGKPLWRPVKRPARDSSGNLLEVSIPDLHIGKLAWGKETGYEDYDIHIAEGLYEAAVQSLWERTTSHRPEAVLLVIGNDMLHTDNLAGTTTAGTQMDTDSRYYKGFGLARELLVRTIDALRQVGPVHAMVMPGNHDQLSAWHLGDSLASYYHGAPDVHLDNEPTPRKYFQWGESLLMFTHPGQKGKLADYPLLMATEARKLFGETRFHECHTGDLHQVRLEEKHGVRVRILPSLCSPDWWHSKNGFTGNQRSAEAYVWNKAEGLIGTATYTVPEGTT